MTWLRVDDGFHAHPKVLRLSLAARGLWVTLGSYAAHYETDGAIPQSAVRNLAPGRTGSRTIRELLDAGFIGAIEGGYELHDFLDYNPSRAELDAKRGRDRSKKKRQRDTPRLFDGRRMSPGDSPLREGVREGQGEEPPTSEETAESDARAPARSWAEWVEREFPDLDDAQREHAIRSGEFWGEPEDALAQGRVRQQVQAWGAAA